MDLRGYLTGLLHVRFQILMVLFCMVSVGDLDHSPSASAEITKEWSYVVGQLSSRPRHRVLAVAALDKSLSMV